MTHSTHPLTALAAPAHCRIGRGAGGQQPATPPAGQQPTSVELRLTGDPGTPPRLAVPDLLALTTDRETQEAAKTIGEALWDDLNFEREFALIPRDTYKSIPAAGSIDTVPFDRWRELGADGVIIGTAQKTADRHSRRDAPV